MDLIERRIDVGLCPICAKVTIETKTLIDPKYGEVEICRAHPAPEECAVA